MTSQSKEAGSEGQGMGAIIGHRGERGFTLIETMIALVIMMVVGLGIASLFAYSINYNSGAADRTVAIAVAQQQLERLRNSPFTDASLTATTGTTSTVQSIGRSYTIQTIIVDTSTTLKTITVQVTPQGAGPEWGRNPVTAITQRAAPVLGPYAQ